VYSPVLPATIAAMISINVTVDMQLLVTAAVLRSKFNKQCAAASMIVYSVRAATAIIGAS
jgi:hypothetical protein